MQRGRRIAAMLVSECMSHQSPATHPHYACRCWRPPARPPPSRPSRASCSTSHTLPRRPMSPASPTLVSWQASATKGRLIGTDLAGMPSVGHVLLHSASLTLPPSVCPIHSGQVLAGAAGATAHNPHRAPNRSSIEGRAAGGATSQGSALSPHRVMRVI